jgi:Flp pilus assembly protein TadD
VKPYCKQIDGKNPLNPFQDATGFMRKSASLLLLVLVAACANNGPASLQPGPGIDVAKSALRGGSPQIALHIADGILASNPTSKEALLVQGDALTGLGRLDEATNSFEEVLAQDRGSVTALIGLGRVRLVTDPAGAETLFLEALQYRARNPVALNDLGIARDLQGRHADAQAAYREALGSDPEMSAARVNLALSLEAERQSTATVQPLRPRTRSGGPLRLSQANPD